jgi:hypothetical protein
MIAPHTAMGPGPSHDAIRANQLIEAGLWLRLGGDAEGARTLFVRALQHDPANRRAQEWLARSGQVQPQTPHPSLEVSVILLDDEMADSHAAEMQGHSITADVLAFLSEDAAERVLEAEPALEAEPVLEAEPPVDPVRGVTLLLQGVEELLGLGDPTSAMGLLGNAEQRSPGDPRLGRARERCERAHQAFLEAKLGDLKRVPVLKLRMAELMRLSLDARTGFLLSRIDGRLSYEALFSVSGMSRPETVRVLVQLLDKDIITLK